MSIAVEAAAQGQRIIWGAPVYDQARIGLDETMHAVGGVTSPNLSRMEVPFPGGGSILFRSLDNPANVRGHSADGVVIDEGGTAHPQAWSEVLRPMLMDTGGWAWIIGTPAGLNWFHAGYTDARKRADSAAWQVPTLGVRIDGGRLVRVPNALENPSVPFSEIEQLFHTMTERAFRQEILAEFVTDGAYFQNVDACATVAGPDAPAQHAGHMLVAGLDWGLSNDYSVMTVLCATCGRAVDWWRSTGGEYIAQRERVKALYARWGVAQLLPERNSMGQPNIEMLRADGLSIMLGPDNDYGWFMSASNKPILIERLALALERGEIKVPAEYGAELRAFEVQTKPLGHTSYSAPAGQHDDCVVSLALAWYAATSGPQIWLG